MNQVIGYLLFAASFSTYVIFLMNRHAFTGNPSRITTFPSYGRRELLLTPEIRVSAMLKGGFARTLW